ncbi:MAG: hypothetical protein LUG61_10755 [Lachnospiraceae bacterium]|nr:hypothetical protein [Lachnospiraceae bacterium]
MIEKIRNSYRVFLKGFISLFLLFQCVLGILYWICNVTRSQQFDTISTVGKLMAALPVLPVHLVQTGLVFAAAYYFFTRFWERRRSLVCALVAVTVPFVMQVCLSETEHAVALAAILCMAAGIVDGHTHQESSGRFQSMLCGFSLAILIYCGAAYSCAAALMGGIWLFIECKKLLEKKRMWILYLLVILTSVLIAGYGSYKQNQDNQDRMQITFESVLFKRFAYPGLNENLLDGAPDEIWALYNGTEIEKFRHYPYLLDTTLESELIETWGEERTRELYLEMAWYGFLCGTKTDILMILEDTLCYLTPQLMYPFYSNGTILAEFGWSYQQFISGQLYLAQLYLYGSLLGYAASLLLTILYALTSGITTHFRALSATIRSSWPLLLCWLGFSLIFMMRGAAIFNYKYAAFQAILGYLPILLIFRRTRTWDTSS